MLTTDAYRIPVGLIIAMVKSPSKTFLKNNASKIAFIYLVKELSKNKYKLIDCQVPSAHLKSLGAEEIPRSEFIKYLN